MKILAYVHGYPPTLNAGAEAMMHQIFLDLKERGHEIIVLTASPVNTQYEGIRLFDIVNKEHEQFFSWCDIVFTHLDLAKEAVNLSKKYKKNVVHIMHNQWWQTIHDIVESGPNTFVIANSLWIQKNIPENIPNMLVNPPTKPDKYKVDTTREFITLINLASEKGGHLFWELARSMPDVKFLGVIGGHSLQILMEELPNVTIVENTSNIKSVYEKTKVLITPSIYESWGRVGIEAACSGIPVVSAPTPGLLESLGNSAVFVGRQTEDGAELGSVDEWRQAIRLLEDQEIYNKYSILAAKRSEDLSKAFDRQIDVLENKLLQILNNNN
jgi:glycosyltransferase involved in cell wall biosynthesis